MADTRAISTWLFALIAGITTADAEWSYKTTQDGQYKLGRNGPNLSVEVRNMIVTFHVPSEWRVSACTDEPMDCIFSAGSSPNGLSLAFSVYEDSRNPSLAQKYRSHLEGIHAHADPKVRMHAEAPFRLADGRQLTPYRYFSDYWGQRLVLLIPEGQYTCEFEFTARRSLPALRASHGAIQQVLDSYRCTHKKPSNQALERTADRHENLLLMTSTLKSEAQLAVVSGRSAPSR
jgi:hypothetical protein